MKFSKEELKEKKKEYDKNRFANRTIEQKEKIKIYSKKWRDNRTIEQKIKCKNQSKKYRDNISPKKRKERNKYQRDYWNNKSFEERKKILERNRIRQNYAIYKYKHPIVVYFMICNGFIKIGCSENIKQRIEKLGEKATRHPIYGNGKIPIKIPIKILHFIDGDNKKEKEIHNLFPWIRYGASEWFKDTKELRDYINELQCTT